MKLRIEIVTPAPPGTLHGNRITALRWHQFLMRLNYQSTITEQWSGKSCDLLIALHGLRSYDSIKAFKKTHPDHPVVLIMTGTDIYRDLKNSKKVVQSMEMTDAIVVLQPDAIDSLPKQFHPKVRVIYQSVKGITKKEPPKRHFLASIIGHLRSEKDPFCAAQSLKLLPPDSKIRLMQLGQAMSPDFKKEAISLDKNIERYQWLGQLSHSKTLQWLSRSHVMIISSVMEGGAHVVSEAIAIGIPVIASDIPGNRGLLGNYYPAYYPVGDQVALSKLLTKAETNSVFYQKLCKAIARRQKITKPELEQESIQKLIKSLVK
ncbi:TIGR04348 family glycosyltransferase [Polynucleobacter sp. es-GGE-1]|uniref:selenoneine biosynthesis selenosugar synthase SenB n=1 Tax=Polynucleobacter sp. es-GGE-1 TaxID=1819724 RepID=UPI001C0BB3ED|nr:selenoneine biosynthesis selenosugar synthase SenB [Polynucleobacter sp. es-GGE-1]MBU3635326.1 TIGR04348 family glycosyltransferase [Polynucleobacter sp. es-GGE-1]